MKRVFTLLTLVLTLVMSSMAQVPRTSILELTESVYTQNNAKTICFKENMRSMFGDDLAILSFHPDDFQGPITKPKDPFYNQAAFEWWSIFGTPGFGQGFLDRKSYNGTSLVLGRSLWADSIAARLNETSIAEVTLPEVLYDSNKREIFARIQIDFDKENIELKDFRFYIFIAADSQMAIQRFDTLDSSLCTAFIDPADSSYFLTDTLDSFYHHDVMIANPTTYEGVDNIIPNEVEEGATYTTTITYTVPSKYNIEHLKVIGLVSDYNEGDITKNEVINVAHDHAFTAYDSDDESDPNHPNNPNNPNSYYHRDNWPTGVGEVDDVKEPRFYPNPVHDIGVLNFTVPSKQWVNVDLFTLDGRLAKRVYHQTLSSGDHRAALTTTGLDAGIYVLRVKGESFEHDIKVVVQ